MSIATSQITASPRDSSHHSRMDDNDFNMHYPKGYRGAVPGSGIIHSETGDVSWENGPVYPAALDYKDSSASAPVSPTQGDIYLLDDSTPVLTITSIAWQSGTTVRYTFSGSPDLSGYSTVNNVGYFYGSGISNSEHVGRFDLTAINNTTKYVEVDNPLITNALKDETGLSSSSAELPHSDWNGASNGDWVRYDSTDALYYRFNPIVGVSCYDKTLGHIRTWDGTRWLGQKDVIQVAISDEVSDITTGTAKVTFRIPYKFRLSDIRANVNTAPTGSTIEVDVNDDGASVFSTVLSIDASEKTSETAATAAVISNPTIEDDSEITIDIDQVGSTIAGKGLKISLIGNLI